MINMQETVIALDIETTGLNPMFDRIIEIGGVKVINGEITEKFSRLIHQKKRVSKKISELTGITNEMLADQECEDEVMKDFLEFAGENNILGHNILFDYSFIKVTLEHMGIAFERNGIDTLKISRMFHNELPSRSLQNMCLHYQIQNEHAHRAFDDAKAAYEIYVKMKEKFGEEKPEAFDTEKLTYTVKKIEPMTAKQKNYLNDLIKYHRIEFVKPMDGITKSEASRIIDKIILTHGKIM